MFAEIAHFLYESDVFNTMELVNIIAGEKFQVYELDPRNLRRWKGALAQKLKEILSITDC